MAPYVNFVTFRFGRLAAIAALISGLAACEATDSNAEAGADAGTSTDVTTPTPDATPDAETDVTTPDVVVPTDGVDDATSDAETDTSQPAPDATADVTSDAIAEEDRALYADRMNLTRVALVAKSQKMREIFKDYAGRNPLPPHTVLGIFSTLESARKWIRDSRDAAEMTTDAPQTASTGGA